MSRAHGIGNLGHTPHNRALGNTQDVFLLHPMVTWSKTSANRKFIFSNPQPTVLNYSSWQHCSPTRSGGLCPCPGLASSEDELGDGAFLSHCLLGSPPPERRQPVKSRRYCNNFVSILLTICFMPHLLWRVKNTLVNLEKAIGFFSTAECLTYSNDQNTGSSSNCDVDRNQALSLEHGRRKTLTSLPVFQWVQNKTK